VAQVQMIADDTDFLDVSEARRPVAFAAMPGTAIHLFSIERSLEQLPALAALLSAAEAGRAAAISHPARRNAYIASRGLLRAALTAASKGVVAPEAWTFGAGPHGKPHVTSPAGIGMHFSLSYTTTLIAVAV